uniref:Sulfate ABC transporter ATP-binding protein n=1 Tax=Firmicutes bacterium enrichment culture clone fosmid MGS-M2 TaxID=1549349 RepID=A0A0B5KGZ2_9FIRM|nr:sulfate ABC transporter ATP-binding protein [Firmicutes bacterium enrichment culture clone fosmid MGS-M2]
MKRLRSDFMLILSKICKVYKSKNFRTTALSYINLAFENNEFVAITGASGSGKSTLLNIIGGLDTYSQDDLSLSGYSLLGYRRTDLIIDGKSTRNFTARDWDQYRNERVGFIFQSYNLISHMTVLENVEMGMTLSGVDKDERKRRAQAVLTRVGLGDLLDRKSTQLSSGQQQRVAIARALVNDPDIILADEPTGALDSENREEIMKLIKEISKEKLVILATHSEKFAKRYASRIVKLQDGKVVEDNKPVENMEKLKEQETKAVRFLSTKRTAMSITTALKISFNNLRTKFARALLTAFAGSIGIAGIALIIAIATGFNNEIETFERETLSAMPIVISSTPTEYTSWQISSVSNSRYNFSSRFQALEYDSLVHQSIITDEYLEHIENIDETLVNSVQYRYGLNIMFLSNQDENVISSFDEDVDFKVLPTSNNYLSSQYSLEAGRLPTSPTDIVVIVNVLNKIDANVLSFLGLNPEESITFDDVIGKEVAVAKNNDLNMMYYLDIGEMTRSFDQSTYEKSRKFEVVGVLKGIPDRLETENSGIFYHGSFENVFIQENSNSAICSYLKGINLFNVTTEQWSSVVSERRENGCNTRPTMIEIFPNSIDEKDEITNYLDSYNKGILLKNRVYYTDYAEMISGVLGNLNGSIILMLIALASLSLFVSSIMIGILVYLSWLERTREIGILRSLGARKKDIARIFNTEAVFIGFVSGSIGVFLTYLVSFPLNNYFGGSLVMFERVISMQLNHAIYLVLVSSALAYVAAFIPAIIASVKNPATVISSTM